MAKSDNTTGFMQVFDHGESQIDLRHLNPCEEARPTELHFKADGSIKDEPSLAIVMQTSSGHSVFGQFSLETLKGCLSRLGYEIQNTN